MTDLLITPDSSENVLNLLQYLISEGKGLTGSALTLGIVQIIMYYANKNFIDFTGRWKIITLAFLTFTISYLSTSISHPDFTWLQLIVSGAVFTSLQSFVFDIYKQFFKRS